MSAHPIDTAMAKRLHEACAIRGVTIVGIPGGWSVLLKLGMNERPLGTQRTNRVRSWRSLDTLVAYLRTDLGIVKIDGIDASQYSAASVFRARPDVAGRMRQAHRAVTDLKGLVPAGEAPVPMEAMLISDRIAQADALGAIWHDADEVFKDLEARTAR